MVAVSVNTECKFCHLEAFLLSDSQYVDSHLNIDHRKLKPVDQFFCFPPAVTSTLESYYDNVFNMIQFMKEILLWKTEFCQSNKQMKPTLPSYRRWEIAASFKFSKD